MPSYFKGTIQCDQKEESYMTLLNLDPEKFFGEKPIKWETGWDSADTGFMDQYYSWVKFVFKSDVSERLNTLPEKFPNNEWIIEIIS
jgi:hypothetical protein